MRLRPMMNASSPLKRLAYQIGNLGGWYQSRNPQPTAKAGEERRVRLLLICV
jgi:hypothetical protein